MAAFVIVQYDKEKSIAKDVCKTAQDCRYVHHRLDTPRAKEVSGMPTGN